jgi:hypothetical protein
MPRTERIFGHDDRDELLKSLAVARGACVKALAKLPAGRTVMRCLIADIVGKNPSFG